MEEDNNSFIDKIKSRRRTYFEETENGYRCFNSNEGNTKRGFYYSNDDSYEFLFVESEGKWVYTLTHRSVKADYVTGKLVSD
jgi:hypothetical protein